MIEISLIKNKIERDLKFHQDIVMVRNLRDEDCKLLISWKDPIAIIDLDDIKIKEYCDVKNGKVSEKILKIISERKFNSSSLRAGQFIFLSLWFRDKIKEDKIKINFEFKFPKERLSHELELDVV